MEEVISNKISDDEGDDGLKLNATEPSDEEVEYYRRVDECAEKYSDVFIENGLPKHALYLLKKMFSISKKSVRLFSGNLCLVRDGLQIYSDPGLIKIIQEFLKRNGELKIVLEKDIDCGITKHPLIAGFKEIASPKVKVMRLKPGSKISSNHFLVMDEIGYRIEHDDGNTKALANFGDKKVARKRAKFFDDTLLAHSELIYSPEVPEQIPAYVEYA